MGTIPIIEDIKVTSGDDWVLPITITSSDGVDFSGYNGFFTLKRTKSEYDSDANAVYQLSTLDGDFTISASGTPSSTFMSIPTFAREGSSVDSAPLPPATYYYDVQLVSPSGSVQTWFKGKYKVTWQSTVRVD